MNRKKISKSVNSLSAWRERAFILALAERALPNAILYLQSAYPELALKPSWFDKIWYSLIVSPNEEGIVALLDKTVDLASTLEGDDNYGALPTRDCLSIIEQALLAGLNQDKKRALEASQASLATITGFIEFSEGSALSENDLIKLFDNHPLVEREFSFQEELIDMLRTAKFPSKDFVSAIRELASDDGVSNIGIGL